MFKRVRWVSAGFVLGLGSSYAVARRVRRTVQRYTPPQVADRLGTSAANAGRNARAAVVEGRSAMRAREADLRAEVGRRWQ
jgi:hypothetical protein